MKRVLFVDDERHVLDGLRRMLRTERHEWTTAFVSGGAEALRALDEASFDVVVSDMRMPGMDGLTLLTHVRDQHPNAVRVVLSGHTELETALRSARVAHQFLSKPTDAESLKRVVGRACSLQALVQDEEIRRAIGGIDSLPTAPRVYTELVGVLENPEAGLDEIAAIVERDAAMTGKVLQLMNSAFFGLPRTVSKIRDAIGYLGISTLKALVMAVEVFHSFDGAEDAFSVEAEQAHALATARIARRLVDDPARAEEAFTAGVVHDIGKLLLAAYMPDYLADVLRAAAEDSVSMFEVERRVRGTTHAEIGAYLLDLWGLPYPIVEAVAHHHVPSAVAQDSFDLPTVVHVADCLAREAEGGTCELPIDAGFLRTLGVDGSLPEWRDVAAATVSGMETARHA